MNILFLYSGEILPERGGVQRVTSVLADEFARRGNGVFYLSLPAKTSGNAFSERQFFLPENDFAAEKNRTFFLDFLKDKKIDVVINQGGNGKDCSRLAYAAKENGDPVVSVCHCGLVDSARNFRAIHEAAWKRRHLDWLLPLTDFRFAKKILLAIYKRKYREHYRELCEKSDRVVLLSESFKPEMAFYFDGDACPQNVISIPNPCSFPQHGNASAAIKKRKELLFVGRIDFSPKRADLLLKIWRRIFKAFPDWRLTVVGGGCTLEETKRMATKMGLERVRFEGFQDPRPYYERAAIFCMTSAWETFGLVLVEAMNYGCVPVAFNSYASAADIVDDGENGFLIPPMNCGKYTETLARLMSDDALRERLAAKAREKAKRFSAEQISELWLRTIKTILDNRKEAIC